MADVCDHAREITTGLQMCLEAIRSQQQCRTERREQPGSSDLGIVRQFQILNA